MSALQINITLAGVEEEDMTLQAMRNALIRRGPMHARMAVKGKEKTQEHLRKLNRHKTAVRLKASPTGHHNKGKRIFT